jgi:predicted RND superfamily exporter protein
MARLGARRPWLVLAVALALCVVSALFALRIEVRTGLQDTMSPADPMVQRLSYLSENFPGAITVLAVLEGAEPDRLVEVAHQLEEGFAKSEHVRDVYLEQPVDFFARRGLLYLDPADLRVGLEALEEARPSLQRLLGDPSMLGLLRAAEDVAHDSFPASDSVFTLSTRVFGRVLTDELLKGRPAARVGVRVDTDPLARRLDDVTVDTMKRAPLPPSDERAQDMLRLATGVLALVADIVEQGEKLSDEEIARRSEALRTLNLERAGLPERYRFNEDKTMLLMEIAAHKDLQRIENIQPLVADLERVRDEVGKSARDVKIGLTGMPPMYQEEQKAILDNVVLVSVLGLLGILAVFIIGFERVVMPALSVVPLVMGVLWTLGVQGAFAPVLNLLNLLFPVLLFGLGIDFAIHLIAGFAHRRALGEDTEQALVAVYEATAPSLVTGAVTTSSAFLILLGADLHALRALGFTAGVGVLMALISMLAVLPAVLTVYDRGRGRNEEELQQEDVDFGVLARSGPLIQRFRYPIFAAFLAATIAAAYFLPNVQFERDPLGLQPKGMPTALLQERVLERFKVTGEPAIFFADDLAEADRMYRVAQRSHTIADPLSVTMAIPDRQEVKAPIIDDMAAVLAAAGPSAERPTHVYDEASLDELKVHLARLKVLALELSALGAVLYGEETQALIGQLRDELNRIDRRLVMSAAPQLSRLDRVLAAEVDKGMEIFRAMTRNTKITVEDLPKSLVDRLRGRDGRWMVLVRANDYVFEPTFLRSHLEELYAIDAEVTGITPAAVRVLDKISSDIPFLTLLTILAVSLLVFLGVRSLRGSLLSLVPLVVGMIWTLGLLGAFGIPLNFVSVLAIPLIVGIGIDDGVHLYHRVRHDRDLGQALTHAGKPIILTSMTTGIGFGSLLLSVHRGIWYLGFTTAIGIVACLIASLVLLPALVAIFDERTLRPSSSADANE